MKKITVIFRENIKKDLLKFLKTIPVKGGTLSDVTGFGRQYGHKELVSGKNFEIIDLPKCRIEMLVLDSDLEHILEKLQEFLQTGRMGDGKIWVEAVERVIRIRTGETGDEAIR